MAKHISYFKLKAKLVSLGYNKAEIKSMVSQIKHFDADLKKSLYYWVKDNIIPGDADPDMVIDGKYSIDNIVQRFGYSVPAAFAVLQAYRNNPDEAYQLLYRVPIKSGISTLPKEKIKELYEKWDIKDEDVPEDESDISTDDETDGKEGE